MVRIRGLARARTNGMRLPGGVCRALHPCSRSSGTKTAYRAETASEAQSIQLITVKLVLAQRIGRHSGRMLMFLLTAMGPAATRETATADAYSEWDRR
jgi:hypothetical protein